MKTLKLTLVAVIVFNVTVAQDTPPVKRLTQIIHDYQDK